MQEDSSNPINVIRSTKRSDLKDLRNKHKDLVFGNKRLRLQEVSEYIDDITLLEFKELLLKLKQKPVPLQLLKKIKNSCVKVDYIEAVFRNDGAFNSLVQILIGNDAQKQLEAAACLTNLACGPHKCSYKVAKASGAYLVSFINGNNYFLKSQSTWTLGNIANDCLGCFKVVKELGLLSALKKALMSSDPNILQSVVFALNACTKYEDCDVTSLIQPDFLGCLISVLEENNLNKCLFLDTASTISNCCLHSIKNSLDVFDTEIIQRMTNILSEVIQNPDADILIVAPLIRSLGFLSYDDRISEFLSLDADFYKSVRIILSGENSIHLIKETIWVLCNVTVTSNISKPDLMPLMDAFNVILEKDKSISLHVLYFLTILASKNENMSSQLVQHEIFTKIRGLKEANEKELLEATTVFLNIVQQ